MSQRSPPKKKGNVGTIVAIVVGIVLLLIVGIVVLIVILMRRAAATVNKATNCNSDADCVFGFKCNTSTKICSQCLADGDCKDGRKCVGPVCVCPVPTITNATVTITQAWPPIISIFIDSDTDYAKTKYRMSFVNSLNTYSSDDPNNPTFVVNPGTTAPTFVLDSTGVACDELYNGYGCPLNCGPGHSIQGKFLIQVENECGTRSAVKTVPISGNCDICADPTC